MIKLLISLLNDTILNIKSNFILNETMNFGDRDPPWLNKNIEKKLLTTKTRFLIKSLITMITILNCIFIISKPYLMHKIEQTKKRYFENISRMLPNKNLNPKKYWSLLNIVLNV